MQTQLPRVKDHAYTVRSCPSMVTVAFLILRSPGGLQYEAYSADGVLLGEIGGRLSGVVGAGSSIHPAASEGLGQGVRILRDDSSGDLLTVDFLGPALTGLAIYSYTPESPWIVTNGQQVGNSYFWFEWQAIDDSPSTLVRLMRSTSAKLADPTVVQTVTVEATILSVASWRSARGPDFTALAGGLWLEANSEQVFWERVVIPLAGGVSSQRASAVEVDLLESVLRAGHPASASLSITQTSGELAPGETQAHPVVTWGGDAEDDYTPWASVGEAIDIAPDPVSGFWVLKSDRLEHYNAAGSLIKAVALDSDIFGAVGLHVLAEPIAWTEPRGGGE